MTKCDFQKLALTVLDVNDLTRINRRQYDCGKTAIVLLMENDRLPERAMLPGNDSRFVARVSSIDGNFKHYNWFAVCKIDGSDVEIESMFKPNELFYALLALCG